MAAPLLLHAARYHAWAGARLLAALAPLECSAALRAAGAELPFGSVGATLNHLAAAEALWWDRLAGEQQQRGAAPPVPGLPTGAALGVLWEGAPGGGQWEALLPGGLPAQAAALSALAGRWVGYAAALSEADAAGEVAYRDTAGAPFSVVRSHALLHVLNHGTHHRGQITVAVARATGGAVVPALDMSYYDREAREAARGLR